MAISPTLERYLAGKNIKYDVIAHQPTMSSSRTAKAWLRLGFGVDLATEHEIEQLFQDCAHGAVPPAGECYGLDVIVDDSIKEQPEVYLEAGDHATLVHFARFTGEAWHGRFSVHD
jgi:Ala-tRNA(Pro) deacylase